MHLSQEGWEKVYDQTLPESPNILVALKLTKQVQIMRGEKQSFYVHSGLEGAHHRFHGIVYDRRERSRKRIDDQRIKIYSGRAHLYHVPFANINPWGQPNGVGWRENREFVGSVSYGIRYMRWTRNSDLHFPTHFRAAASTMQSLCMDPKSRLKLLPKEVIHYIMNLCKWDDWGTEMEVRERKESEDEEEPYSSQDSETYYSLTQGQLLHLLMHNHMLFVGGDDDEEGDGEEDSESNVEDESNDSDSLGNVEDHSNGDNDD